ncbi:arthropod defensin domain-containing protein [Phthorimaea operculella]|nr:arthropod defensin domain-containing protein [Phthorimaea operculella]
MSQKVIFGFVLALVATVLSAPSEQIDRQENSDLLPEELTAGEEILAEEFPIEEVEALVLEEVQNILEARQARVTCDLLSGIGWNHSFCAAHCIYLGYKGGACNDRGVCVCR